MFEKLKDYILEKQVRWLLKQYYAQFGLTLREAERLPMQELLEKINTFLKDKKNEFGYYGNVISNLEERVAALTIDNKEFQERVIQIGAENKALNKELAKVRKENYDLKIENYLYKQKFNESALTKDKVNDKKLELSR